MPKLSKKRRIRKKQIKALKEKSIIVGKAYDFLFDDKNKIFDKEYKDYI